MPKQVTALHRLVHSLEAAVARGAKVRIEAPKRLRDKDTNRLCEHDVVVTFTHPQHELMVACECRDRSRRIGAPEVEAFHTKCQRTGINRGIIVSPRGFTETALQKADSFGIGCLTLEEVDQFNWCVAPGVDLTDRSFVRIRAKVLFPEMPPDSSQLYLPDGTKLTDDVVTRWAIMACDRHVVDNVEGEVTRVFVEQRPALHTFAADGRQLAADTLVMQATYRVKQEFVPFEFRRYMDLARNKVVNDTAVAALGLDDGRAADLLLKRVEDGSIEVSVVQVPEGPKAG